MAKPITKSASNLISNTGSTISNSISIFSNLTGIVSNSLGLVDVGLELGSEAIQEYTADMEAALTLSHALKEDKPKQLSNGSISEHM